MGQKMRQALVMTTVEDVRAIDAIERTSKLYHREAWLLARRLVIELDRSRRVDLLTSLQTSVWQAGRCDSVLDLVAWGCLSADAALRFSGTLPTASERRQAERQVRSEMETLRDLRGATAEDNTPVMWKKRLPLMPRGAWLIAVGTMLAVACWSYLEGVLLRK